MIYVYKREALDEVEIVEREFPIGLAPAQFMEDGKLYRRCFTPPSIIFDGPDFSINQGSKSPLMRIPRKQRI